MLKKKIVVIVAGIALLAAIAGSVGFVADPLKPLAVPGPCACHLPGHGGGGC